VKDCFDVEDKKGYVKCSNGSIQLTGLDGREAINLRLGPTAGILILSYHGNDVYIYTTDMFGSPLGHDPRASEIPSSMHSMTYVGEEPIGAGAISRPVFKERIETETSGIKYKYAEDKILIDLKAYIDSTYDAHYNTDQNIQVLDGWLALGSFVTTCRDVAIKYLWRYGKKNGSDKKDLMKTLHYTVLAMFGDHYRD
jgi:uncharacterized protein DUF3310